MCVWGGINWLYDSVKSVEWLGYEELSVLLALVRGNSTAGDLGNDEKERMGGLPMRTHHTRGTIMVVYAYSWHVEPPPVSPVPFMWGGRCLVYLSAVL